MRSEEKAKESCGMQLSDFVVPPGISRANVKQHKAMRRACESVGYRHCLSPELSHHLDASGGDKVV